MSGPEFMVHGPSTSGAAQQARAWGHQHKSPAKATCVNYGPGGSRGSESDPPTGTLPGSHPDPQKRPSQPFWVCRAP